MKDVDFLAELWAWREEFSRSHNDDLGAMCETIKRFEETIPHRIVKGEPRRPEPSRRGVTPGTGEIPPN